MFLVACRHLIVEPSSSLDTAELDARSVRALEPRLVSVAIATGHPKPLRSSPRATEPKNASLGDYDLTRSLIGLLLTPSLVVVVGCFGEGPSVTTSTTSTGSATESTMSGESSTGVVMDGGSSSEGGTSMASTSSEATSTTGNDDGCGSPVEIPVGGPFAIGQMQTLPLDFDDFPAAPGTAAELCITFTTDNPASARTVTIGAQVLAFGPCGGRRPPSGECLEYLEPAGIVDVAIDNSTFGPCCQDGGMDDLILRFGCAQESGSTGG